MPWNVPVFDASGLLSVAGQGNTLTASGSPAVLEVTAAGTAAIPQALTASGSPAVSAITSAGSVGSGNEIVASSASRADVQAAVNAASDGDTVLIPNGSATWTSGITTTKQIIIKAQNYTPTSGGSTSRNVTLTASSSGQLFNFTTGNTAHCGLVGIRFNEGSQSRYISVTGSGSKPMLVADCTFEFPIAYGNNPGDAFIAWEALGGVFWNCYFISNRTSNSQVGGLGCFFTSPRSWETASTMGDDDTNGDVNLYVEDSTMIDCELLFDVDQAGRFVLRNSSMDGSALLTHGFTSGPYGGGRHVEVYDNTFESSDPVEAINLSGRYFWLRAGTCVITDNDFAGPVDTASYGPTIVCLQIGDNTAPSGSDAAMQPGWGHNGTTDIREPIYIWDNTGAMGSEWNFNDSSGSWSSVTNVASAPGEANAEIFVDLGAKPGYSKYTYPHPFRNNI